MKLVLLTLLAFVFPPASAVAQDTIVWFHTDFPPMSIIQGSDAGTGASDKWGRYLMEHLPEFRHEKLISNVARQHEEMKHRDNACFRSFIKTPEREKYLVFSEQIVDVLPNGLVTLSSRKAELEPFMNQKGELRLAELLADGRYKIGVASGRSFGPKIDSVVGSLKGGANIVPFASGDIFYTGLVYLSKRGTVDGLLGYAIELEYGLGRLKEDPSLFTFLPIAEDTSLVPVYISCSKSPMGEKIISRINQVIRSGGFAYATTVYRAWLPSETRDYYDRLRKEKPRSKK